MKLSVVGLGKIGLPIAMQAVSKGVKVIGCDINSSVVEGLNNAKNHIIEEPGLQEILEKAVPAGLFRATTDVPAGVSQGDIVIIVVPLVVDGKKNVDYSIIDSATKTVAKGLKKGQLVIYETTLPVGDTRNHMMPLLEESGLKCGTDFFLAHSPERVYTGQVLKNLSDYPKIVGGVDEESLKRAVKFYETILDAKVIPVKTVETAEYVKIMGMTYRDVNIGLANEFAKFAHKKGIDITDATIACNTNPHAHVLRPGIGVGGHCAPVYPYFIINEGKKIDSRITLAERARLVNDEMSDYAVELLGNVKGKTVLILGLAFRENVKETAFTTTTLLIESLKGANVLVHDPLFSEEEIKKYAEPADLEKLPNVDYVIVQAYHKEYHALDFNVLREAGCNVVVDGRNMIPKEKVENAGMKYVGIGK